MTRRLAIAPLAYLLIGIAAAQEPAADPEITPLRNRMMQMAVRAGAIRTSLQNLRRQLESSGLGLRTDIVEAEQRLVLDMDAAEAALDHGSATEAGVKLDAAETELGKLEKFLNR